MNKLFKVPPVIGIEGFEYHGCHSYSEYNYLQNTYLSCIKRRHFEIALNLTSKYFYKANVIDFGCGDGIFLPSLSKYFCSVLGIEKNKIFCSIAQKLVEELDLKNVKVISNDDLTIQEIKKKLISEETYEIVFLLEVMEHIGTTFHTMYEDKITFLKDIFSLMNNKGIIVISVPKMVGLSFLVQHLALTLLSKNRSDYTLKELIECSFFKNTSNVEKYWVPDFTHKGFNHEKFERCMGNYFEIKRKTADAFQVLYVIGEKRDD